MLRKLIIRNFAIIDELSIEFSEQLNLITGETGAGKSILVGALNLLLGQKVDSKALFKQGTKCIIEGIFEIQNMDLKEIFDLEELDYQTETFLRREISLEGKSRAFINDTPVSLSVLQEIGNRLVDIHSQHETLNINQESFQVRILDSVSGNISLMENFKSRLSDFRKRDKKIQDLESSMGKNAAEADFLQFQLDELEKAKITDPQEQEVLESELMELNHAEEIQKGLYQSSINLDGEENSVLNKIKQCQLAIQGLEKFYHPAIGLSERIKSVQIELKDVQQEIEGLLENRILSTDRMEAVQSRLHVFYGLEQKHRVADLPSLIAFKKDIQTRLEGFSGEDTQLHTLKMENDNLKEELIVLAEKLHKARKTSIPKVEKEIKSILNELGIKDGEFLIVLEKSEEGFTPYGWDRVRFLFSANKGFAPADLSKVASGGELSRLVLAIKTLSSQYISMPTLLFDEIDTGVSGEVALKVGRVMKKLSLKNQVIAITHLPQIASRKGAHFLVYKDNSGGITKTQLKELNMEMRVQEIAKMLSGNNPGEFALKNASELMESA